MAYNGTGLNLPWNRIFKNLVFTLKLCKIGFILICIQFFVRYVRFSSVSLHLLGLFKSFLNNLKKVQITPQLNEGSSQEEILWKMVTLEPVTRCGL